MSFGIMVFDGAEELDFVGPWELVRLWSRYAGGPERCLIVSETAGSVNCAQGLSVMAHVGFDDCPNLDFVLIPGGRGTRREVGNPAVLDFVASQARQAQHVLSVCTGAFILHAAGLLNGRRATTYWDCLDDLRNRSGVDVVEQRFVRDGNIWTSAGVSAGLDLVLELICDVSGETAAGTVQAAAEYFPSGRVFGSFASGSSAPGYLKHPE